jgi:hypothetical protein
MLFCLVQARRNGPFQRRCKALARHSLLCGGKGNVMDFKPGEPGLSCATCGGLLCCVACLAIHQLEHELPAAGIARTLAKSRPQLTDSLRAELLNLAKVAASLMLNSSVDSAEQAAWAASQASMSKAAEAAAAVAATAAASLAQPLAAGCATLAQPLAAAAAQPMHRPAWKLNKLLELGLTSSTRPVGGTVQPTAAGLEFASTLQGVLTDLLPSQLQLPFFPPIMPGLTANDLPKGAVRDVLEHQLAKRKASAAAGSLAQAKPEAVAACARLLRGAGGIALLHRALPDAFGCGHEVDGRKCYICGTVLQFFSFAVHMEEAKAHVLGTGSSAGGDASRYVTGAFPQVASVASCCHACASAYLRSMLCLSFSPAHHIPPCPGLRPLPQSD